MAEFDLTQQLVPYLDRHMVLPLLEYLDKLDQPLYESRDLLQAQFDLVRGTKMIDYAAEMFRTLQPDAEVPSEFSALRKKYMAELEDKAACGVLVSLVEEQPHVLMDLRERGELTMAYMSAEKGVTAQQVEALFDYAKVAFECGRYEETNAMLDVYMHLSQDDERRFWAMWGKLASEILVFQRDAALEDLTILRDMIAQRRYDSHLERLKHWTWLVHWSLFIFFAMDSGGEDLPRLVDFLMEEQLINAVQANCPHILRYLTAAAIVNRRQPQLIKQMRNMLNVEDAYSDPITDFLLAVYVEFDFAQIQSALERCQEVLRVDFFLNSIKEPFMAQARQFAFEILCKIHSSIDVDVIKRTLCIQDDEQSDAILLDMIRHSNIEAKLDTQANLIVMTSKVPSIHQRLIDRTKPLASYRYNYVIKEADKRYQYLAEDA